MMWAGEIDTTSRQAAYPRQYLVKGGPGDADSSLEISTPISLSAEPAAGRGNPTREGVRHGHESAPRGSAVLFS